MTELKVKAGDQVVYKNYNDVGQIISVDRITPSGRIVCGSQTFEKDGLLRGRGQWSMARIEEVNKEDLEKIERSNLIERIKRINLHLIPITVLRNVCETLVLEEKSHE